MPTASQPANADSVAPCRREFLAWITSSPLLTLAVPGCAIGPGNRMRRPTDALNVLQLEDAARSALDLDAWEYLAGGADDMRTVARNVEAFREIQIRARRLVDVSTVVGSSQTSRSGTDSSGSRSTGPGRRVSSSNGRRPFASCGAA